MEKKLIVNKWGLLLFGNFFFLIFIEFHNYKNTTLISEIGDMLE